MASKYTYDDFQRALTDSGLNKEFSDADLKLALDNPDAGMSILKYKQDYHKASTPEAKALANLGAEGIRSGYGGYTGGASGGQFYLDPLAPKDFESPEAPTYDNAYKDRIDGLLDKQLNYGSFSYDTARPEYSSRHDDKMQSVLDQVVNRGDFSYDPQTDPLYSQYRKQYAREGQRATQDALGAAAAATGGIPSSYAVGAATQAGDYYASQMTDKIPELYQLALNKYMNEHSMKLADLSALSAAEQADYEKYVNELNQYNIDKNFAYGAYQDDYNRILQNLQSAMGLEQTEYSKYLDKLNQYNNDREFNYSKLLDEINNQTSKRSEALNKALAAAELGDYSLLEALGINSSNNPTDFERRLQLAKIAASYGDYSGLKALGIDTSAVEAPAAAKYSSPGYYSAGGGDEVSTDYSEDASGDGTSDLPSGDLRRLNFDADNGTFRWGGSGSGYEGAKTYSSVDDLLDAFDKANLSEADISVLERKLRSQMGAGKGK